MGKIFQIDDEAVRQLADILNDTNLTEIEYEDKGSRIRVVRSASAITAFTPGFPAGMVPPFMMGAAPAMYPASETHEVPPTPQIVSGSAATAVRSPMVGTAYLSPEPGSAPFVKVGDIISVGQPLLIIEAMKVMNQIKSAVSGKITQIHVRDGQPVEFDTELFSVE